ncbi:MAG: hypothetical protein AB7O52_16220 [Planctomycetota bacterium]
MRSIRLGLLTSGWILFVISLGLVAIDSNTGGDYLRGFGMRGYQCFLGVFLAPLVRPQWTPLWLVLASGSALAAVAPWIAWRKRPGRVARALLVLGAAGAIAVSLFGERTGVVHTYAGYYVWCAALITLAITFLLPVTHASSGSDLQSETRSG